MERSGGIQLLGEGSSELHDSGPFPNPAWKRWFAAMAASTALPGTPGAIPTPPTPSNPPVKLTYEGGFPEGRLASCPEFVVAKIPAPARRSIFGLTSYASAARGGHCRSGVDPNE